MKDMIIKNDVKYRVAEYALFRLTEEGILFPEQYEELRDELIDIYNPIIGELERGMKWQIRESLT